jgi:IS30 family transposase
VHSPNFAQQRGNNATGHEIAVTIVQHGSNENTNCLRRRYFPKGTDPPALLSGVPSQICPVIHQHPRKTLGLEPACQLAASGVLQ